MFLLIIPCVCQELTGQDCESQAPDRVAVDESNGKLSVTVLSLLSFPLGTISRKEKGKKQRKSEQARVVERLGWESHSQGGTEELC